MNVFGNGGLGVGVGFIPEKFPVNGRGLGRRTVDNRGKPAVC